MGPSAGFDQSVGGSSMVPEGRLNYSRNAIRHIEQPMEMKVIEVVSRPFGTLATANYHPALKRRAIISRRFATQRQAAAALPLLRRSRLNVER